jgi:hypothetical protein
MGTYRFEASILPSALFSSYAGRVSDTQWYQYDCLCRADYRIDRRYRSSCFEVWSLCRSSCSSLKSLVFENIADDERSRTWLLV